MAKRDWMALHGVEYRSVLNYVFFTMCREARQGRVQLLFLSKPRFSNDRAGWILAGIGEKEARIVDSSGIR